MRENEQSGRHSRGDSEWRENERGALAALNRATLEHWAAHGRAHGHMVPYARREGPGVTLVQYGVHHAERLWAARTDEGGTSEGVEASHNERMRRRLGAALARDGERGIATTKRETLVLEWAGAPGAPALQRGNGRSPERVRDRLPCSCLVWSAHTKCAVLASGHAEGAFSSAALLVLDQEERWERAAPGEPLRAVWNIRAGEAPRVRVQIGGVDGEILEGTMDTLIGAPARRGRAVERNLAGEIDRRGEPVRSLNGKAFKAGSGICAGEILREQRVVEWGLSHEAIAYAAGLSNAALQEIMRGRAKIGAAVSARLGAAFEEDEMLWAEIELACERVHLAAVKPALLHGTKLIDVTRERTGPTPQRTITSRAQAEQVKTVLRAFAGRLREGP